ncbi:kinase-like protein [Trematosphaeria pertusa]|uniref:Kinase-like protein n=1 Tax=Trematosphaeria pertusa TaxID=390896 RepID=A0A6A6I4H3_9PLEO|nr:kinase-like protein [Trematosphaeria pertusa]KAF2245119.1 kinase-like protein [Trematosphaeria pertusa]
MSALTDDEIVSLCHDEATTALSASQYSNKVVRITERLAVKFGQFVTAQEFRNQQVAQRHLDPNIVNVPTAYRFIQKERAGYIVMDYIHGDTLDLASAKPMAEELGKVLGHIHQQKATIPGPLGGGPVSGVLWPEHEEVEFSKTDDLQFWFDRHSPSSRQKLDLRYHPLSMCHLDFNPRNIIVDGRKIYLIDWSAAGYFPRYFEHILYQFLPQDLSFFNLLSPFLAPLSEQESESATLVVETLRYSQVHVFPGAKVSQRANIGA